MTELSVVSAYTREPLQEVDCVQWPEVDAWLQQAQGLRGRPLPPWQRLQVLERLAGLLRQEREEFARLIAAEGGKPLTDALVEADRAVDGVQVALAEMRTGAGAEVPMGLTPASEGRLAFTIGEPIGTVVALSAFNHPLNLIVHQAVPAIATGCPVLVKPAEPVPLCALRFAELCRQAGLGPEWLWVAPCQVEVAARMASDPRVAFLTFIGSARVGWMLRSKLAPGARCALEHGGAAPVIALPGADLDAMVAPLAKGGMYHAGQVCVSVQRVFAQREQAAQLAQKLAQACSELRVGDPLLAETEVGPLIRPAEAERVAQWVQEAVQGGASLLCGGERLGETCHAPTVLLDPAPDARVSREEIFGPVICVYSCDDVDQAVERANSLDVAFQAAVFGGGAQQALGVAQRLDAATVMLDDHTAFRTDWMPFAGRRHSGLGVGGIGHTMRDMTAQKLIVLRSETRPGA